MSTWEQRMSARAAERDRAERASVAAERTAEKAAEDARSRESAEFRAGPPGGCGECWIWSASIFSGYEWWHVTRETPDGLCRHECHGDGPVYCLPVAFA